MRAMYGRIFHFFRCIPIRTIRHSDRASARRARRGAADAASTAARPAAVRKQTAAQGRCRQRPQLNRSHETTGHAGGFYISISSYRCPRLSNKMLAETAAGWYHEPAETDSGMRGRLRNLFVPTFVILSDISDIFSLHPRRASTRPRRALPPGGVLCVR